MRTFALRRAVLGQVVPSQLSLYEALLSLLGALFAKREWARHGALVPLRIGGALNE